MNMILNNTAIEHTHILLGYNQTHILIVSIMYKTMYYNKFGYILRRCKHLKPYS